MNREEFKKLIESIGFEYNGFNYVYEECGVSLYSKCYNFFNSYRWVDYEYNDLTPLKEYFKKELRSIKLKQILG